jgi:4-hydroxybenzoate polyprenyltransferase
VTEAAAPRPRAKLGALLALCRVSNLPTVWMNVLAALVLSDAGAPLSSFLLLAASLSAFYCGGMGLNDLCDRESDAREQPFRPIPSGRVGVGEAWLVTAALFAAGLGLLALAPHPSALAPGAALLGLIALYDWLHKRHAVSVVLMAACRAMVFVVTGWAATGALAPLVLLAGGIQLAYTLLVTGVARLENARGERFRFPVIPWLLAGMALVDGVVLALAASPGWLAAGAGAALLTRLGQRYVRGD